MLAAAGRTVGGFFLDRTEDGGANSQTFPACGKQGARTRVAAGGAAIACCPPPGCGSTRAAGQSGAVRRHAERTSGRGRRRLAHTPKISVRFTNRPSHIADLLRAKEDLLNTAFEYPRTRRDGWQDEAACRDSDVELFFPTDGERGLPRTDREAAAKAVCADCPVRVPCLDYALTRGETHGIWGGFTEDERASERRRRRRAMA